VGYCAKFIEQPTKAHFILITDLYEGGDEKSFLQRMASLKRSGVNVLVLLALTDEGRPSFDKDLATKLAGMDIPCFACTPDQFPDLMGACLRREEITTWASTHDIKLIRNDTLADQPTSTT
jgi:hypothetical protein